LLFVALSNGAVIAWVYEEERIIAEFDGVAIRVDTRQSRKDNS